MKKLLGVAFLFLSQTVLAATTADLSVGGTILPPSCDITMQGAASTTFSYGNIAQGNLNLNTATTLAESASQDLAITCAGPTVVAFKGIDNRSGGTSAIDFSLGQDGAGNLIGTYRINTKHIGVIANGAAGTLKYSRNNGATWANAGLNTNLHKYASDGEILGIDGNSTAGSPLQAITTASMIITVTPTISARSTLDLSTQIALDGSATIELMYM